MIFRLLALGAVIGGGAYAVRHHDGALVAACAIALFILIDKRGRQ